MTEFNRTAESGLQERNRQELSEYEEKVPMTPEEKRALHKWVESGHRV